MTSFRSPRSIFANAGRRVRAREIFDLQSSPGTRQEEPGLDIMAFTENIFAGILEALPPEQLLNVSRVKTPLPCSFIICLPA
jgi:hypothetical protein